MGLNGISCRASGSSGFLSAGAETSGRTCHHSGPGSEPAVLALETSSVTEPEANEALIKTSDTGPRNGFRLHPHGGTYRGAFHRWILSRCFHITPQLAVSCLLVVLVTVSVLSGCTSEEPLLQDDACVLALLLGVLHAIFEAAACPNPTVRRFFRIVPSLLLCYFIPGLLGSAHVISPKRSQLPAIASGFLLPSCLVLLTIGTNAAAVARLGRTAVAMFAIGALGVMLGGPVAVAAASLLSKEAVAGDTWKGLACIAGSWIGGSANQLAMKEVFEVPDGVFAQAVAVDVFVSNLWMAALLLAAENSAAIDAWLRADASGIAELGQRMEDSALEAARVAGFRWLLPSSRAGPATPRGMEWRRSFSPRFRRC
uniref:Membrane protein n=1 Tax=Tetraselmis sp. GSL018 TaxID=582737 RepID=A0A061RG06_9CHLO